MMTWIDTQTRRASRLLLAPLLWLTACGSDSENKADQYGFATGPLMKPGDNCLRCHRNERSDYPEAPAWSAAGTVFPGPNSPVTDGLSEVRVILITADGQEIETLTTNSVGNFYTATELPQGFRVALAYEDQQIQMPCPPPAGNCAACHNLPAVGGSGGRLFIPQAPESETVATECMGFGN